MGAELKVQESTRSEESLSASPADEEHRRSERGARGAEPEPDGEQPRGGRLIASFDCTMDYPSDRYFECGDVQVTESPAGRYREAEARPLSRFGYRFPIEHVGRPHVAVIRYPDDKRRYMCVMDGTCYDLTTGVFTGDAQPVGGCMEEIRQIFWPRWHDCSIVFMTWGKGEPAAVSSIDVYELDCLAPLSIPGDPGDGSRRELGIQYEDPCGTGASEGALTREEWIDRVVAYARHSGQKLFVYPIAWYHGPQLPLLGEPADAFDAAVAPDRRQYTRWSTAPPDWLSGMLDRFGREGLEFQASLTLMRLGSLMQKMNTDLDSIRAGADTINNMLWNDKVQAGTQDWTPIYNARNFEEALEYGAAGRDMKDFPWAYGEKTNQPYHAGPIFNPVHPVVQDAILAFVTSIVDRYGSYPAFKGISLNLWFDTFVWFCSLHTGYDDYTANAFEQETGIKIPVDKLLPNRFSERYEFLVHTCRPAWIAWRCKKIHELFCRIRDIVIAGRPDLRLVITFWNEMFIGAGASRQLHAKQNTVELCLEGGLDLRLFSNEHGIEIDYQLSPSRDRAGGATQTDGADRPACDVRMHRDHDFLDRESLAEFRKLPRVGAFIFNSWVEAWGEHKWFPCGADDSQAAELAVMNGEPAEGIFRINSTYPEDGFWWDSQLRITPGFQGGPHFMEHYAHAVAEFDACRITRGGLFLDKAHTAMLQGFARAYRALPKEHFETVGESTDPVAVRTLARDGRRYFYLVNRDYYTVEVEVLFSRAPAEVVDLASGEALRQPARRSCLPPDQVPDPTLDLPLDLARDDERDAARRWRLSLGPYELKSLAADPSVAIEGFCVFPPPDMVAGLETEAGGALQLISDVRARGNEIPGMDAVAATIRDAAAEGRLALLRRALSSYVVLRCRELASDGQRRTSA